MLERLANGYPRILESEVADDDLLMLWDVTRAALMNMDMATFRRYVEMFCLKSYGSHRLVVGTLADWEAQNPNPQVGDIFIDITGL